VKFGNIAVSIVQWLYPCCATRRTERTFLSLCSTSCLHLEKHVYECFSNLHLLSSCLLNASHFHWQYFVSPILLIVCTFATLNQQNSQYCSLDIYITVSHRIFLNLSTHKGSSLGNHSKDCRVKPNYHHHHRLCSPGWALASS